MSYADQLQQLGQAADAKIVELADQVVQLTTANEQLAGQHNTDADTILQLQRRVRKLQDQLHPPRVPLFGAKPEPNTEGEYAISQVRAGVPYRVHRHYAKSWADAIKIAGACRGEVCALTVATLTAGTVAALPDTRPILLGVLHEPEDNIANGEFTLGRWLAAQDTTRDLVNGANVTRSFPIRFGGTLMGYTWRGGGGRDAMDYWPGINVWDHIGTDVYPGLINPVEQFIDPGLLLGSEVAYGKQHDVDVAVMEWGITTDAPGRADYIRSVNDYARRNELLAVSYWDHGDCALRDDDEFRAAGGA